MKNFLSNWLVMTAILILSFIAWADAVTPAAADSGGNQLMQNTTHWYEKPAETVGPVESFKSKSGTLLTLQPGSAVYLIGKSTLHDYQMNAHGLKGSVVLKGFSENLLKVIQNNNVGLMSLVVPVETFKSRESGLDDNAYKALSAKLYPNIEFKLLSETVRVGAVAGTYVMTALGTLTVAGVTAPVALSGAATITKDQIRFKGTQKLKFSDFKIKPPSASVLIVTITCSDEFEVHYDVIFGLSAK